MELPPAQRRFTGGTDCARGSRSVHKYLISHSPLISMKATDYNLPAEGATHVDTLELSSEGQGVCVGARGVVITEEHLLGNEIDFFFSFPRHLKSH